MLAPCWVLMALLLVTVSSIAALPAYEVIKVMEEDLVASIIKKRMYEGAIGEYSYHNCFWMDVGLTFFIIIWLIWLLGSEVSCKDKPSIFLQINKSDIHKNTLTYKVADRSLSRCSVPPLPPPPLL